MTSQFDKPLSEFEDALELPAGFTTRDLDGVDSHAVAAIAWLAHERPERQNFWPALCLAFIAQAEKLLGHLGTSQQADAFTQIARKVTSAAKAVDQLVWIAPDGTEVPVRRFYNAAAEVIIGRMRREHPSAPGHATSKWLMYEPFIASILATSPSGRRAIAEWVWEMGVLARPKTISTIHRIRQPRPFFEIIESLDTGSGTTGGAMFQAIVYGYLYADSPTLTVVSQRVNTGSRRAGVIGDVSGYLGENVVLAAEAKDKHLGKSDEADLLTFIEESSAFPDLDAVVFARSFDPYILARLEENSVRTFSTEEMLRTVRLWDVPKQENAVRAMRFFLGHIQKNQRLVDRVEDFLQELKANSPTSPTELPTEIE
ncbi:hypothetical protein AB0I06_04685 [Streptomyces sp. NPDC050674]|uniref:hypothetical protein n=1 Tax=Streptomyces sp. NPDC050674 TaxID=3157216 RepID=UPI0034461D3D